MERGERRKKREKERKRVERAQAVGHQSIDHHGDVHSEKEDLEGKGEESEERDAVVAGRGPPRARRTTAERENERGVARPPPHRIRCPSSRERRD